MRRDWLTVSDQLREKGDEHLSLTLRQRLDKAVRHRCRRRRDLHEQSLALRCEFQDISPPVSGVALDTQPSSLHQPEHHGPGR
jgi:hypothetical protein